MTNGVMRILTPPQNLQVPRGLALSDSKKAEAVVDSLEAQFQAANNLCMIPSRNSNQ
jgi:hypothetical protein